MAAPNKYTQEDWDDVRTAFASSLMASTKLTSLAENVGKSWPLSGADEVPSKYIDLTWEELNCMNGLAGRPERVQTLVDLLKETLAFDNPFGDLVGQIEEATSTQDELGRLLAKLEIAENFPIRLTNLSIEVKEFCTREEIETIGAFITFCQNMAKNIVIGGDYRDFLNALAHLDEGGVSHFVPYRKGEKGLHLIEAVNLAVGTRTPEERAALAHHWEYRLSKQQEELARKVPSGRFGEIEKALFARVAEYYDWFPEERDALVMRINRRENLERDFIVLNDPLREFLSLQLLKRTLAPSQAGGGLLKNLSRWFKR